LKTNTQPIADHQIRLAVEVEPAEFERAQRRVARELASRMKIPGFRPGKAPFEVIQKTIGDEGLRKETIYAMVDDVYPKALEEAGIDPYGVGTLDEVKEGEPLQFFFKIPLQPVVDLGEYHSVRVPYIVPEVTNEEIEDELLDKLENEAIIEQVERPAAEGDVVTVILRGRRVESVEGQPNELVNENGAPFIILPEKDDQEQEWPFPGFTRNLLGLSAGEEKQIAYKFADDSRFESLRGIEAEFDVKVEKVSSRTLPSLDDDFAQSVSDFKTLEELRADIRNRLETEAQKASEQQYDEQIITKLLELASIAYPPQMVEEEYESSIKRLQIRLENLGISLDTYLKMRQVEKESFEAEMREKAVESIRKTLLIFEIAKKENIEVTPEEIHDEAQERLSSMRASLSKKDAQRMPTERLMSSIVNNMVYERITERFWDRIRQIARGEGAEAPGAVLDEQGEADSVQTPATNVSE